MVGIIKRDNNGRFIKGNQIKLGTKHTQATKDRIRELNKGKIGWSRGKTKATDSRLNGGKPRNEYTMREGRKLRWTGTKHEYLHRINWMMHNQVPIPKGWVIHHMDLNPLNNEIDNLSLLPNGYHLKLHWEIEKKYNINRFGGD